MKRNESETKKKKKKRTINTRFVTSPFLPHNVMTSTMKSWNGQYKIVIIPCIVVWNSILVSSFNPWKFLRLVTITGEKGVVYEKEKEGMREKRYENGILSRQRKGQNGKLFFINLMLLANRDLLLLCFLT